MMHPFVDTLLSGATTVLLQSTLILGVALGLAFSLRRNSSLRYAILLSALIVTLLAGVVAVWNPIGIRGIQVSPRERAFSDRVAASEQLDEESRAARNIGEGAAGVRPEIVEGGFPFASPGESTGPAVVLPAASRAVSNKDFPWRTVGLVFLAVWGAGSAFLLIRLILGLLAVKRLVRGAIPLPPDRAGRLWRETTDAIGASGARHRPILASSRVSGPIVVGAFRPRILLPQAMLDDFAGPRLRAVLAHETAHVLRRDTLVGLLERWAQILLWPQPLLGILLRSLDRAREEVCDNYALAVADRREYGRLLLALTADAAPSRQLEQLSLGLLQGRWSLERRISEILNPNRNTMTTLARRHWIAPTVAITALAIMAGGTRISFAQEEGEREERKEQREQNERERAREGERDRLEAQVKELRGAMREAAERGQKERARELELRLKALLEEKRERPRDEPREKAEGPPKHEGDRFEAQVKELKTAMREAAERGQEDRAHALELKIKALLERRERGEGDRPQAEREGNRFEAQVKELSVAIHEAAERGQKDRVHALEQKLEKLLQNRERDGQGGGPREGEANRFEAQVKELRTAMHEAAERGQEERAQALEQKLKELLETRERAEVRGRDDRERPEPERARAGEGGDRAALLERRLGEMAEHMEQMQRAMREMQRELERLRKGEGR